MSIRDRVRALNLAAGAISPAAPPVPPHYTSSASDPGTGNGTGRRGDERAITSTAAAVVNACRKKGDKADVAAIAFAFEKGRREYHKSGAKISRTGSGVASKLTQLSLGLPPPSPKTPRVVDKFDEDESISSSSTASMAKALWQQKEKNAKSNAERKESIAHSHPPSPALSTHSDPVGLKGSKSNVADIWKFKKQQYFCPISTESTNRMGDGREDTNSTPAKKPTLPVLDGPSVPMLSLNDKSSEDADTVKLLSRHNTIAPNKTRYGMFSSSPCSLTSVNQSRDTHDESQSQSQSRAIKDLSQDYLPLHDVSADNNIDISQNSVDMSQTTADMSNASESTIPSTCAVVVQISHKQKEKEDSPSCVAQVSNQIDTNNAPREKVTLSVSENVGIASDNFKSNANKLSGRVSANPSPPKLGSVAAYAVPVVTSTGKISYGWTKTKVRSSSPIRNHPIQKMQQPSPLKDEEIKQEIVAKGACDVNDQFSSKVGLSTFSRVDRSTDTTASSSLASYMHDSNDTSKFYRMGHLSSSCVNDSGDTSKYSRMGLLSSSYVNDSHDTPQFSRMGRSSSSYQMDDSNDTPKFPQMGPFSSCQMDDSNDTPKFPWISQSSSSYQMDDSNITAQPSPLRIGAQPLSPASSSKDKTNDVILPVAPDAGKKNNNRTLAERMNISLSLVASTMMSCDEKHGGDHKEAKTQTIAFPSTEMKEESSPIKGRGIITKHMSESVDLSVPSDEEDYTRRVKNSSAIQVRGVEAPSFLLPGTPKIKETCDEKTKEDIKMTAGEGEVPSFLLPGAPPSEENNSAEIEQQRTEPAEKEKALFFSSSDGFECSQSSPLRECSAEMEELPEQVQDLSPKSERMGNEKAASGAATDKSPLPLSSLSHPTTQMDDGLVENGPESFTANRSAEMKESRIDHSLKSETIGNEELQSSQEIAASGAATDKSPSPLPPSSLLHPTTQMDDDLVENTADSLTINRSTEIKESLMDGSLKSKTMGNEELQSSQEIAASGAATDKSPSPLPPSSLLHPTTQMDDDLEENDPDSFTIDEEMLSTSPSSIATCETATLLTELLIDAPPGLGVLDKDLHSNMPPKSSVSTLGYKASNTVVHNTSPEEVANLQTRSRPSTTSLSKKYLENKKKLTLRRKRNCRNSCPEACSLDLARQDNSTAKPESGDLDTHIDKNTISPKKTTTNCNDDNRSQKLPSTRPSMGSLTVASEEAVKKSDISCGTSEVIGNNEAAPTFSPGPSVAKSESGKLGVFIETSTTAVKDRKNNNNIDTGSQGSSILSAAFAEAAKKNSANNLMSKAIMQSETLTLPAREDHNPTMLVISPTPTMDDHRNLVISSPQSEVPDAETIRVLSPISPPVIIRSSQQDIAGMVAGLPSASADVGIDVKMSATPSSGTIFTAADHPGLASASSTRNQTPFSHGPSSSRPNQKLAPDHSPPPFKSAAKENHDLLHIDLSPIRHESSVVLSSPIRTTSQHTSGGTSLQERTPKTANPSRLGRRLKDRASEAAQAVAPLPESKSDASSSTGYGGSLLVTSLASRAGRVLKGRRIANLKHNPYENTHAIDATGKPTDRIDNRATDEFHRDDAIKDQQQNQQQQQSVKYSSVTEHDQLAMSNPTPLNVCPYNEESCQSVQPHNVSPSEQAAPEGLQSTSPTKILNDSEDMMHEEGFKLDKNGKHYVNNENQSRSITIPAPHAFENTSKAAHPKSENIHERQVTQSLNSPYEGCHSTDGPDGRNSLRCDSISANNSLIEESQPSKDDAADNSVQSESLSVKEDSADQSQSLLRSFISNAEDSILDTSGALEEFRLKHQGKSTTDGTFGDGIMSLIDSACQSVRLDKIATEFGLVSGTKINVTGRGGLSADEDIAIEVEYVEDEYETDDEEDDEQSSDQDDQAEEYEDS